ncbi:RNA polymerase sigma factor sigma-70 region 4 domain-containing protein [Marilutibacter maris]|uniref:Membrane protein n=1 Tax=Marilutibacter maris TaxID=1605891 RepID=A0A2U9T9A3_9GAMM|nr:sigma-70 region 4 domain-containing protein [Lysobacter maris]AWV06099.1 membrane protein [Lysobacter maris]
MSDRARREPRPASAALAAFMRGVERRAAVLAELQAGDAAIGDAAVEAALYAFRSETDYLSMNEWPQCFWAVLLAQPSLQRHVGVSIALEATDRLAELGHGPRAAVLLHMAAGLGEDDAARVMGISPASYRLALHKAMADPGGGLSGEQVWLQLREQVQRRIRGLSEARQSRLAQARETALAGALPEPAAEAPMPRVEPRPSPSPRRRGLIALLWLLLALCALAFVATFWWPFRGLGPFASWSPAIDGAVRVEPLPAAEPPARTYDGVAALVAHPDFERLADPENAAIADDLAFYSWLAAEADGPPDPMLPTLEEGGGHAVPGPDETSSGPETDTGDAL